jgi:hypothetical protein
MITFDVKPTAQPGPITFTISLEVGNLPDESVSSLTASSNLIAPHTRFARTLVVGGAEPKGNLRLIKKVAEYSGSPHRIEDSDILWALRQWTRAQPVDGILISDKDMIILVTWWQQDIRLAAALDRRYQSKIKVRAQGQELVFIISPDRVRAISVSVYDLGGRLLFVDRADGPRLSFTDARRLPNGVYFYLISTWDSGGRLTAREVRQFALVR